MLNNCKLKLLEILMKTPFEAYSINYLAKRINLAYPHVYESIMRLEKAGIIIIEKKGKSNLCKIRFNNPEVLAAAALINLERFLKNHPNIKNLTNQLKEALSDELYILLLFGSYAKGTAKKTSDIDLFFIIKDKNKIEQFKNKIISVISKLNYKVEFEVSTIDWFCKMLNDKTTVGREVFKNNRVLHDAESYFQLVKEYDKRYGY